LARGFGAPGAISVALRALAACEKGETTIELLREAAELTRRSEARLEHAHALVELGAALRRSKQRAVCREPLSAGLDLAHRCGAQRLAEQARAELLAAGARPRRMAITGAESLTPSERRVADMAASGLSNREIAQRLYVTTRTVEGHLTSVFRKLGINSRAELRRCLASPGGTART
jgi:DNA-binding CsgD family transcriptional regulator